MKEEKRSRQKRDKTVKKQTNKSSDKISAHCQEVEGYTIYTSDSIGKGTYGEVFKAKKQGSDQIFACKIILKKNLQKMQVYSKEIAEDLYRRFELQGQFQKSLAGCENIVKMIDFISNSKAYYYIMEFCDCDLSKILKQQGTLPQDQALKYFRDLLDGYKSIRDKKANHRDLKPQNLLIKDGIIKIADFGFIKTFNQLNEKCDTRRLRAESKVGSIKYMAPNLLDLVLSQSQTPAAYNPQKSDIWSMGIILYKMLYGSQPFLGSTTNQLMKNINKDQLKFPQTVSLTPQLIKKTTVSEQVKSILKKMINKQQKQRIGFRQLYKQLKDLMLKNLKKRTQKHVKVPTQKINKKEQLLLFYNKLMITLYRDAVNYNTLKQIKLQGSCMTVTYKIMTLLHEKRSNYIQSVQSSEQGEIPEHIQQQILGYHNSFNSKCTQIASLERQQTLISVLVPITQLIKKYTQFDMMMSQVQVYLVQLLILYTFEKNLIDRDHIVKWMSSVQNAKQEDLIEERDKLLTLIAKDNGEEIAPKKKKDKVRQQQKKQQEEDEQTTSKRKQKKRSSKQKSQEKHRSKDKKDKK